jgi:hypothetical protein
LCRSAHDESDGAHALRAKAELDKEHALGLTVVAEQRAKAVAYAGAKREELQRKIEAMHEHEHKEAREVLESIVQLNVGGHRFETSVQTLRRVPGTCFDAHFSNSYTHTICADGSIFIDRDGELFKHILEYLRDGVVSVVEQEQRPV